MFTGLVIAQSRLLFRQVQEGGQKVRFSHSFSDLVLGESIAVSGACLTVIDFDDTSFAVEMSNETLRLTILGDLALGDPVNLERALSAGERLGGHLVTGHVDGLGTIKSVAPEGEMTRLFVELPAPLLRYVAKKGSLTVDGVSLTVNDVDERGASLLIIPHTSSHTTLGQLAPGSKVNLEVDLIARYLERLMQFS